ncbi:hypothetical protein N9C93_00250, partial [Pelagibacterales bacterium]|nr:hypothetical protein [Pelagibacterales bacterium]
ERSIEHSKILCVAHGGGYGLKMESMNFEDDISDIKANWYMPYHKKHIKVPAINLREFKRNKNKKYITLVCFENPIYPNRIESTPISGQSLYILDHIDLFFNNLADKCKDQFLIKPYSDEGWATRDILKKSYGNKIVIKDKDYKRYFKNTKLLVTTYPETTFCEGMFDGPTILIYKPELWEIRDEFNIVHKKLLKCNIIFLDPIKAANHVNKNFQELDKWWNDKKTMEARDLFKNYIADSSKNSIYKWKNIIKNQLAD